MATPTWSVFMLTRGTVPSREEGGGVSAKHPPPCPRSAAYTRITANTPVVGNKREPRRKNLTNPGESLSTGAALPESIIPKGYFLVLVPSLICPHPLDPLCSLPFCHQRRKKEGRREGAYRFHRHSVGRCSFRPRGVKITGGSGGKNATRESSIVLDG